MTTVDLAERLLAIGRQLQATECQLTRPSTALELPPVFRQLLTDPLARLADLLQPFTNWWCLSQHQTTQHEPRRPIEGHHTYPATRQLSGRTPTAGGRCLY